MVNWLNLYGSACTIWQLLTQFLAFILIFSIHEEESPKAHLLLLISKLSNTNKCVPVRARMVMWIIENQSKNLNFLEVIIYYFVWGNIKKERKGCSMYSIAYDIQAKVLKQVNFFSNRFCCFFWIKKLGNVGKILEIFVEEAALSAGQNCQNYWTLMRPH